MASQFEHHQIGDGMVKNRWYKKKYHLDRMSFRDLVKAYVSYPGIQIYFLLVMASSMAGMVLYQHHQLSLLLIGLSVLGTLMAYPFVEYGVHRFILHGRYLYRSPLTAALWKRIHYDHHQDPNDLRVLFGALSTTLPTVAIATLPIGWGIAGFPGVTISFATGLTYGV